MKIMKWMVVYFLSQFSLVGAAQAGLYGDWFVSRTEVCGLSTKSIDGSNTSLIFMGKPGTGKSEVAIFMNPAWNGTPPGYWLGEPRFGNIRIKLLNEWQTLKVFSDRGNIIAGNFSGMASLFMLSTVPLIHSSGQPLLVETGLGEAIGLFSTLGWSDAEEEYNACLAV